MLASDLAALLGSSPTRRSRPAASRTRAGSRRRGSSGEVPDLRALRRVRRATRSSRPGAACCRCVNAAHRDPARLAELDALADAVPDEPRRQPRQPRAGARVARRPARGSGRRRRSRPWTRASGSGAGHAAPAMGAVLARARACPLEIAQRLLCLYGAVRGVLAAAVRLGIAGSYDAQRLQHDMTAAIARGRRSQRARSTSAISRRPRRSSTCCRRRTIASTRACFSPEGSLPCLVRASTIIRTNTTDRSSLAAPGPSPSATRRSPATTPRAPSPSASAARSAAARPRCCSRSAARCAIATASRVVTNDIFTQGGRRVPGAQRGAAAGAHPRGRDRRLPAHRRARRHQPEPRGARPADGAVPARSCCSSRAAATTSPRSSAASSPTTRST